ncbi:PTS system mannose/fructose/sorbose family transporter subunit IID [Liquorilactobacillus satsumensis]|uniref:PTS system mannose/fructose/sorbose family transporter subunit IID n=1 Tax=Liquorilactobacillus satsumensis TaxID=259059 RepID=UPI001E4EC07A|nr:PTS system mannose/fructose/sorbose family transporter subunit IID [Liquorilactobacillus satsumensis]MCC7667790.1 PTS N-acetylglucosamine transporter subunit IIABC [Liquorilactobacillus satsumensis]MCP9356897.1 PTS system mannose/fructose/sorbose family transporter subunit IID [Liquorilactobacillus satsumensis]MCP9370844.1 PTS system mannose/fructose/sorbose family transporter subunit IID [Liquorilactobacillus satsumensis]
MSEENNKVRNLSKKELIRSWLIWTFFCQSNYNYERMQATGFLHAIAEPLKKFYKDDQEGLKKACERHMEFFNTEPNAGGGILGVTLALEEKKAQGAEIDDEMISSIKTGLMGPLAGIGDTIWQGTLSPIALSVTLGLAMSGNLLGPLLYILIVCGVLFGIGYFSFTGGYYAGRDGVNKILKSGLIKKITEKATIVGATVLGALAASYVTVKSTMIFYLKTGKLDIQADILDKLFKGILPLLITLLTVYLIRKKVNINYVLLILIAIGVLGTLIGFLG